MQLNQVAFATSLGDSNILSTLENIGLKNPKTDQQVELIFGKDSSNLELTS